MVPEVVILLISLLTLSVFLFLLGGRFLGTVSSSLTG